MIGAGSPGPAGQDSGGSGGRGNGVEAGDVINGEDDGGTEDGSNHRNSALGFFLCGSLLRRRRPIGAWGQASRDMFRIDH